VSILSIGQKRTTRMSEFDFYDDPPKKELPPDPLPPSDSYEAKLLRLDSLTPFDVGIKNYLARCNQRGSKYSPKYSRFPNFTQIARYCDCDPKTIARIENGETQNPSMSTLSVISALAMIYPPHVYGRPLYDEQKARRRDADDWLNADPDTRGNIMDALLTGINNRLEERFELAAQQAVARD